MSCVQEQFFLHRTLQVAVINTAAGDNYVCIACLMTSQANHITMSELEALMTGLRDLFLQRRCISELVLQASCNNLTIATRLKGMLMHFWWLHRKSDLESPPMGKPQLAQGLC